MTKIHYYQNGEYTSTPLAIENLQVANIGNHTSKWLPFSKTFTRSEPPVHHGDINKPDQLKQQNYLEHVTSQLSYSD